MSVVKFHEIMPFDIVQINPAMPDTFFAGCFLTVTEVRPWGIQGYVTVPAQARGEMPSQAYVRVEFKHIELVGRALWGVNDG